MLKLITKKQKVFFLILFLVIFIGKSMDFSSAHAPARFLLEYEFETETLSIDIEHPRMYPEVHYIDNVVIWLNDVVVRNETYTSQQGDNYHLYFVINATHMDVFKAFGRCCIGGNATDEITVYDPDKPIPTTSEFSNITTQLAILGLGIIVVIIQFRTKRK